MTLADSRPSFPKRHAIPLALLGLAILAYAPTAPFQGLYWDDWGVAYITRFLGPRGFFDWNAVSRPLRAPFDLLFSLILGYHPPAWQVAGLLLRWGLALAGFYLFDRLWPARRRAAFLAASLLLLYPGLSEQYLPLTFAYFWLVGIFFCLSMLLTLRAVEGGRVRWALLLAAAALTGLQQFLLEYLFGLEVLRFLLLWRSTRGAPRRLTNFSLRSLPFLISLGAYAFWRVAVFDYGHYRVTFPPLAQALADLFSFAFTAGPLAWSRAFTFPLLAGMSAGQQAALAGLTLLTWIAALVFLRRLPPDAQPNRQLSWSWMGLGLLGLLVAGLPALLGGQTVRLTFPEDRLTYPFLFGAALLLTGFSSLITDHCPLNTEHCSLAPFLLAFAVALQFQYACFFLQQKQLQRAFIWQLTWRAPALQPGTALLTDDVDTFAADDDEALSYLVNWTYAPDQNTGELPYVVFMLSANFDDPRQFAALPSLQQDFFQASYAGDPRDVLAIRFAPPSCLRVLDARYDANLIQVTADPARPWRREATVARALPSWIDSALAWSNPSRILPAPSALRPQPPVDLVGPELPRGWCYYFERAELARQQGDWALAASLGDQAFSIPLLPADYSELLVFVEAYVRTGRLEQAEALARWGLERAPVLRPAFCDMLGRLIGESGRDPARVGAFAVRLQCP